MCISGIVCFSRGWNIRDTHADHFYVLLLLSLGGSWGLYGPQEALLNSFLKFRVSVAFLKLIRC